MSADGLPLLRFDEAYFERIWGGNKLRTVFGKNIPQGKRIGEAWLISDHAVHESRVADGPLAGQTLRQILTDCPQALLGTQAKPTLNGRFPLLLKLLDATKRLSVQVHPDDACAERLGEPDAGKTEMWYVLDADTGSKLICGLSPGANTRTVSQALSAGTLESLLHRFKVNPGAAVFVPAGTVHAIGGGILLAEIQQNSDLTYRMYDWGRTQSDGTPRALHVEKALAATHFGSAHGGEAKVLSYQSPSATHTILAACPYFAAERIEPSAACSLNTNGQSFHVLLAINGALAIGAAGEKSTLRAGEALLVPACTGPYSVAASGAFLLYYVPNLVRDVTAPLRAAGHEQTDIVLLCGAPAPHGQQ